MKAYNRVCARIDLDAVEYNIEMMRRNVREGVKMLGVVKTDGYGHGAVQIAKMLSPKDYMWGFAVATLDEAFVLHRAGIEKPLRVVGCIFPDYREEMIKHDIRMTLYKEEMAHEVPELAVKMGE